MNIRIGTAGWAIGAAAAQKFPAVGTTLERYSALFNAAEINSSFHRPHRASTWERWRDSVPDDFRFSVKMPKTISHERKLVDCGEPLEAFLEQASLLGDKLAILLLQLPPKLAFDAPSVSAFLDQAQSASALLVIEPRHPSWFEAPVDGLLLSHGVGRVAADPAICPAAALPGGAREVEYWRLHGSPIKYRSSYQDRLSGYATQLIGDPKEVTERWCIFDNTASSAAVSDALALEAMLKTGCRVRWGAKPSYSSRCRISWNQRRRGALVPAHDVRS